jgi:ketosteroid isomerase-like protein
VDEQLTPGTLVAVMRAAIEVGEMPPLGKAVPADEALAQLADGLAPLAAPDVVCLMVGAPGVMNTYPGLDGVRRGWEDWSETFSALDLIIDEVLEVPAGAVALTRQRGVTRHGGMRMEQRSAMLVRVRDGRIAALEFHLDRETARSAGEAP